MQWQETIYVEEMVEFKTMSKFTKDCDVCKGTGKDPKKRSRPCQVKFCRSGKVPTISEMCNCTCHEICHETVTLHIVDCCAFSYALRKDIEKDPNFNVPTVKVADLGEQLTQKAQKDLDDLILSDLIQPGDCEICGKPDGH